MPTLKFKETVTLWRVSTTGKGRLETFITSSSQDIRTANLGPTKFCEPPFRNCLYIGFSEIDVLMVKVIM